VTRNKILVGIGLIPLAALIVVSVRLRQRAAFRNEMRPLVQEDLSDFTQDLESSGQLMIGVAISKRERRIGEIKLFEVGHYRNARDLVVDLMQAEDSYLADGEEVRDNGIELQADVTQSELTETEMGIATEYSSKEEVCSVLQGAIATLDAGMEHLRLASVLPTIFEDDRKRGVLAWNRAYGWMKWMGLDVDPRNPFSSLPNQAILPNSRKSDLERAQGMRTLRASASSYCGDSK